MAEFLLTFAAEEILKGLISLASNQIRLLWDFNGDLEELSSRLGNIQALLRGAERKRIEPNSPLERWLKKLKAGSCWAENVLDELAYEDLRRRIEEPKAAFRKMAKMAKMAKKVNDVNVLLKGICDEAKEIGLSLANQIVDAGVEPRVFRPTHPYVGDSVFVGRHDDVSEVIQKLTGSEEEDNLSVIAIQGMGGLGKTTLAKLVYKDAKVVEKFGDKRMWICVSDDSDVFKAERILSEMVVSLTREKFETPNIQGMVNKLKETLEGHKYLLVLDDVWNKSSRIWIDLRASLIEIGGSKGSKILVTTRSMDVVSAMQVPQPLTHRVGKLPYEHCWAMFEKRVFSRGGPIKTERLEVIGKRMVEKCKGVPLAVNSIGGLLYANQSEREWESIDKSERWRSLENEDGIRPVLRLSYDHLSSSLKRCFAYCSIFPKDTRINKDTLIHLWMGLGYLHPSAGSGFEMEDIGNDHFNILSRNSFFQEEELDEFNNITSCKMHDLVHDLALEVAEGSCLTFEASDVENNPDVQDQKNKINSEVHHLSLHLEEVAIPQNLRTLMLTGHLPTNFDAAKCVRVLRLMESHVKKLPSSMRKFIHLRYLDLSGTKIKELPKFITKLYNLETLVLPRSLQNLPKDFHMLVRLRHLCMDEKSIISQNVLPAMLGKLTSLQTLSFFVVGEAKGHKIEELGSLKQLRGRLRVNNLMFVNNMEEAKKADIGGKKDIQELVFHFGQKRSDTNHADVLEGLKPHENLKALTLEEFGGQQLASWMANPQFLQNLVKMKLRSCRVCEQVPTLGHLPHLEVVEMEGLDDLKCISPNFYGLDRGLIGSSSGSGAAKGGVVFPALRKFSLENMRKLEAWSDVSSLPAAATSEIKFFPCLEELRISNSPQLVTIPGQLLSVQSVCISTKKSSSIFFYPTMDRPSLLMKVDQNSETIGLFLEDLLGKSSRSLRSLGIRGLEKLHHLWNQELNLTSLEKLVFDNCSYQNSETFGHFLEDLLGKSSRSLRSLEIYKMKKLHHLWNQELNLTSLENLVIQYCSDLNYIFEETEAAIFTGLPPLQRLVIQDCSELRCLPKRLLQPTLAELSIRSCPRLEGEELRSLMSLKKITISGCPRWESNWEKGLLCSTSLQKLVIGEFSKHLSDFPWPCSTRAYRHPPQKCPFISLESLTLFGWRNLTCLPNLEHLTALKELEIQGFDGLEALPEWLGNLSSLQSLKIWYCPNLKSLPSREAIQRLANFRCLFIRRCDLLKERCKKESGDEWHKIEHIPLISFAILVQSLSLSLSLSLNCAHYVWVFMPVIVL